MENKALVNLKITYRANCIGIAIPEMKSISSSWIQCSATSTMKLNTEYIAWGAALSRSLLCMWQDEPHLCDIVPLFTLLFFSQGQGGDRERIDSGLRVRPHSHSLMTGGSGVGAVIFQLSPQKYPQLFQTNKQKKAPWGPWSLYHFCIFRVTYIFMSCVEG